MKLDGTVTLTYPTLGVLVADYSICEAEAFSILITPPSFNTYSLNGTFDSQTHGSSTTTDSFTGSYCSEFNLIEACTDPTACNYYPGVSVDDGSCLYGTSGCNDPLACNYNSSSTCDDGSCVYPDACGLCEDLGQYPGCIDDLACNFDSFATCDDNSCLFVLDGCGVCGGSGYAGCLDPLACNYDFGASCDDGCVYIDENVLEITNGAWVFVSTLNGTEFSTGTYLFDENSTVFISQTSAYGITGVYISVFNLFRRGFWDRD